MWSTRDQEAESMDERKESPSRVTAVRVAVLSGKEANREPRETTGWERRREEGASILTTLPHIALPSGHFILELGTWNMESHSEPTLI